MLYARALSRLARRLFADVIGPVYVEGELRGASYEIVSREKEEENMEELISLEDIDAYLDSFGDDKPWMVNYAKTVAAFKKWSIPRTIFEFKKDPAITQQKFETWKNKQKNLISL